MSKPLLIVFIGFPGSGKTYFATRLAERLKAVTLNSDALRLAMFGSMEAIEHIRKTDESRLYRDVFGAMDYAATQALRAGHSVVYDAQQTKRRDRKNIERLARQATAQPVFVWMKTDKAVAMRRAEERDMQPDSHQYSADTVRRIYTWVESRIELPEPDEHFIEISGELPFAEQYAEFQRQRQTLLV